MNLFGSIDLFLQNYGYLAIFIGSLLEGEFIVITAGAIAYTGVLSITKVILFAFIGTLCAEQCFFYIGRFLGKKYLHKFPRFHKKIELAFELLREYQNSFILACRFIYGIRIVSPFIIGSARIHPARFAILNVIAALIWAVISAYIGYFGSYIADHFGYTSAGKYVFLGIFILINMVFIPRFFLKFLQVYKKPDHQ